MDASAELSAWLRVAQNTPRIRVHRICERTTMHRCRRGCMRAALNPCIDACIRAVADPAVKIIGLPCILTYIITSRDKLLKKHENRPENEQRALSVLTNNCLRTCVPKWTKQWAAYCDVLFKRVCIRMCTCICERSCRRSCRMPCTRTPLRRIKTRGRTQLRVGLCLLYCIDACVQACLRMCKVLLPKWLNRTGKHICRPVLNETARRLAAKWLAEDIIKERRLMTDKCNVLNGCKF